MNKKVKKRSKKYNPNKYTDAYRRMEVNMHKSPINNIGESVQKGMIDMKNRTI